MKSRGYLAILLICSAGLVLAAAETAAAGSCTDGTDCYCDQVVDSQLLLCEDFESVEFYEDGHPHSWWRHETANGGNGRRGTASLWRDKYGSPINGCAWSNGTPANPKRGITCDHPKGGSCGTKEYASTQQGNGVPDLWDANATACIDVVRNGDFDAEVATNQDPLHPGVGRGVFEGRQSFGYRIGPGQTAGILGAHQFGRAVREIGITAAMAYSSNLANAGADVFAAPWKHEEWTTAAYGNHDTFFMINTGWGDRRTIPFQPTFKHTYSSQAECQNAIGSSIDVVHGGWQCTDVAFEIGADPSLYDQSVDWPWGTWGCVSYHVAGMGSRSMAVELRFNDELIMHIRNIDSTQLKLRGGIKAMQWNSYANRNQTSNVTTETAHRYVDNYHVREGPPVSCAAIGFGSSSGGTSGGTSGTSLGAPGRPGIVDP